MKYVSRVLTYKAATLPKTPFGVTIIIDNAFSGIVATLPAGGGAPLNVAGKLDTLKQTGVM